MSSTKTNVQQPDAATSEGKMRGAENLREIVLGLVQYRQRLLRYSPLFENSFWRGVAVLVKF